MREHTISQESSAVLAELFILREVSQSFGDRDNDNV